MSRGNGPLFNQGPELQPALARRPAEVQEALAGDQAAEGQHVHLRQVLRHRAMGLLASPARLRQ
eukprot:10621521-Lingulodinium_polyedra.AAC.1